MDSRSDDKLFEALSVRYNMFPDTEDGRAALALLASELQKCARSGMSLEDMHSLYPRGTEYRRNRMSDAEQRLREKMAVVEEGETVIFWTEEGFMIVRGFSGDLKCNPSGHGYSVHRTVIHMFIRELKEIKKRERVMRHP